MKLIQERLQAEVDAHRIHGAVVAITDRHELTWLHAAGDQRPDDIFFIASTSKALAATTIVILAEQGALRLDLHMRQLLSHTSGVFGNDTKDPVERDLLRNAGRTLAEAATGVAARPLIYAPGEGTSYSDAGMMLAGRAAEVATGQEFDAVMRDTLLAPLGMRDTFYRASQDVAPRLAVSYQRAGSKLQRAVLQHRLKHDGLIRVGSGLFSTAADLAAFLRFHLSTGDRFAGMRRDHTGGRWQKDPMGGMNRGYGLGWQLGGAGPFEAAFFHAGAFGSLIWADATAGIGVVLLTQMPILQVYPFWRELLGTVQK